MKNLFCYFHFDLASIYAAALAHKNRFRPERRFMYSSGVRVGWGRKRHMAYVSEMWFINGTALVLRRKMRNVIEKAMKVDKCAKLFSFDVVAADLNIQITVISTIYVVGIQKLITYRVLTLCCLSGRSWSFTYGSVAVAEIVLPFACSWPMLLESVDETRLPLMLRDGRPRQRTTETTKALRSTKKRSLKTKVPSLPYSPSSTWSWSGDFKSQLMMLFVISFSAEYFVVVVCGGRGSVDGDWAPGSGFTEVGDGDFFK